MDVSKLGYLLTQQASENQSLDTVRALHETVVSLRAALDKSREELRELRAHVEARVDPSIYEDTIEKLSIENHILRQRVLNGHNIPSYVRELQDSLPPLKVDNIVSAIEAAPMASQDNKENESPKPSLCNSITDEGNSELAMEDGVLAEKADAPEKTERPEASVRSISEDGDQSLGSEHSQPEPSGGGGKTAGESDNESEELDDIELIFTTEETKELGVMQEDLVSFTEADSWQPPKLPLPDSFDETKEEPENGRESDLSVNRTVSDLTKVWSQSVLVETDISKCGVVDEFPLHVSRRNTLPNPVTYQPIIHREVLGGSRSQLLGPAPTSPRPVIVKFAPAVSPSPRNGKPEYRKSPLRPILVERNSAKRESEAQTDITALPSQWKSESYLAHKVSHNFTTLPSKFSLPVQHSVHSKYSLKLSDKTQEARRTLLSDINFTSMVPELSRSADYLCQEALQEESPDGTQGLSRNYPRAHSYMKNADSLMSPGFSYSSREYGKDQWSPCNCGQSGSMMDYGSMQTRSVSDFYPAAPRYRGSLTSIPASTMYEPPDPKRRHAWRSSRSSSMPHRPTWGSVPSSPTHTCSPYVTSRCDISGYSAGFWPAALSSQYGTKSAIVSQTARTKARNRVTFQESSLRHTSHPGQSLPDLRSDFEGDSGDSTDSLIDEAEEYLRRSIDSILTGADWSRMGRRRQNRRHSEPDPVREFTPPQKAQPFLPKVPRDLKLDYFVKVITSEGRVIVGRVRYVGSVPNKGESHIGVELPKDVGDSDGTFQGRRFFDCDPHRAVFVPFKKVVMAWSV